MRRKLQLVMAPAHHVTIALARLFALMPSGQLLAWGLDNGNGALGLGEANQALKTPTPIGTLPPIQRIVSGYVLTLALDRSGNVWGWGSGGLVRPNCNFLGSDAPDISYYPRQIPSLSEVIEIALHSDSWHSLVGLAVKQDGSVWQWGYSYPEWSFPTPVQVQLDRVAAVYAAAGTGYAIRDDGSLWKWGYTNFTSPVQVLASGALRFVDAANPGVGMVQMADGHLLKLRGMTATTSAQSPLFAAANFGAAYSGRLNTASVTVDDDTDLRVAIASSTSSVDTGQDFDYVLSVSNDGSGVAHNAAVTVALPSEISIRFAPAGCSVSGQSVTCSLGDVAAGQTTAFSIMASALSIGSATATAYAFSDSYDYLRSNDVAGIDVSVQLPAESADADVPTLPEWGALILGMLLMSMIVQRGSNRGPARRIAELVRC